MFWLNIWDVLGIVAILSLIVSFGIGKNAIWGGISLGIVICLVLLVINLISGNGLNWLLYKKVLIICTLAGALFEVIGRLSKIGKKN